MPTYSHKIVEKIAAEIIEQVEIIQEKLTNVHKRDFEKLLLDFKTNNYTEGNTDLIREETQDSITSCRIDFLDEIRKLEKEYQIHIMDTPEDLKFLANHVNIMRSVGMM